jgi:hypothetical protein
MSMLDSDVSNCASEARRHLRARMHIAPVRKLRLDNLSSVMRHGRSCVDLYHNGRVADIQSWSRR